MILPNPDRLNRFNKYALVMLAAKRTRQLQEQGIARRALVKSTSTNPLTIALEEIAAGRLIPSFNPEPLPELMEPEVPETSLTEEFEEAMAKVAVEAGIRLSDNGHEQEEEPQTEEALEEDEIEISEQVDTVLGLDEEDEEPETIVESDEETAEGDEQ
ncbi:MAG: DNA-directed RNA polymerase subunit omega [Chthonomonadetes bacterium]|nr:DNA-directed RNA polymerase subunit omega [Chthonomonadetes bacterium]